MVTRQHKERYFLLLFLSEKDSREELDLGTQAAGDRKTPSFLQAGRRSNQLQLGPWLLVKDLVSDSSPPTSLGISPCMVHLVFLCEAQSSIFESHEKNKTMFFMYKEL